MSANDSIVLATVEKMQTALCTATTAEVTDLPLTPYQVGLVLADLLAAETNMTWQVLSYNKNQVSLSCSRGGVIVVEDLELEQWRTKPAWQVTGALSHGGTGMWDNTLLKTYGKGQGLPKVAHKIAREFLPGFWPLWVMAVAKRLRYARQRAQVDAYLRPLIEALAPIEARSEAQTHTHQTFALQPGWACPADLEVRVPMHYDDEKGYEPQGRIAITIMLKHDPAAAARVVTILQTALTPALDNVSTIG